MELDRPEIAAADAATNAGVTAEAGLAWTEGAITAEAASGETATVEVSSGPDPREVMRKVVKEVLASMRASELPEMLTQAASGPGPASGATTNMPAPEPATSATASSLLFEATANPEKASQGAHAARMVESGRSEASSTPKATAKGVSGGKVLVASTGSGITAFTLTPNQGSSFGSSL
jgi:hypothetical protein